MNYAEIEEMIERLEEIRLTILRQEPTRSEETALYAAYSGVERALDRLRALCGAEPPVSTAEGGVV